MTAKLKTFFYFLLSLLYAYQLASIPSWFLSDRSSYSVWYKYANERLSEKWGSFSFFTMEPLYYLFNKGLFFLDNADLTLQIFAFFISFSFSFFALNYPKKWYVSIFLLLIFVFELKLLSLQLNALRQGIAVGFLFLFFQYKKEITYKSIIIFCAILGLIHFTFILITFLLFIDYWLIKNIKTFTNVKRLLGLIAISVIISVSALSITSLLGAKQAGSIEEGPSEVSGLGFVYWLVVFLYIWFIKPKRYENNKMQIIYSVFLILFIFYLSSYFFMPLFGRLLNTALPFAFLIILHKPKILDYLLALFLLIQAIYLFFNTDRLSTYVFMSTNSFIKHILGFN